MLEQLKALGKEGIIDDFILTYFDKRVPSLHKGEDYKSVKSIREFNVRYQQNSSGIIFTFTNNNTITVKFSQILTTPFNTLHGAYHKDRFGFQVQTANPNLLAQIIIIKSTLKAYAKNNFRETQLNTYKSVFNEAEEKEEDVNTKLLKDFIVKFAKSEDVQISSSIIVNTIVPHVLFLIKTMIHTIRISKKITIAQRDKLNAAIGKVFNYVVID